MFQVGLATVALVGLAACGTNGSTVAANNSSPATVALQYTEALFGGHLDAARQFVAPASQNTFLVVTAGLGSLSMRTQGLTIGSTSVSDSTAVAILMGTLCSSHGLAPLTPADTSSSVNCVTNSNPHSANPVFRVQLIRNSDGRWLVTYRAP